MKRLNYLCLVGLLFVSAASAARGENIEWVRPLGTSGRDISYDVSADGLGNVYISGHTEGSLGGPNAGSADAFVSKYDAAGTLQWSRQLGTGAADYSLGVSADGLGNVYISGYTGGSLGGPNAGSFDAFVSKYDATGTLQWTRQLGTSSYDDSWGVSADGLGNVYFSGHTTGSLGGPFAGGTYDAFVSKYDAAGAFQWSRQLGTSTNDWSYGVSADGLGNVYISGFTDGSLGGPNAGGRDAFVGKYDATGTLQWSRQLGTSVNDESHGVSADGLGNVYISGYTLGSLGGPNAGGNDAFVSKYDAAGTLQWSRQLGTVFAEQSYGVSADGLGNVYISGDTAGSLGGPNAGGGDAFVSKYDAAGTLQWTRQLVTSGNENSYGVSADGLGNVYFSGRTWDPLGGPNDDAFVAKIADPAVPEPNTLLLLCFGSLAVLWRRRGLVCASILAAVVSASFADRADADTFGSGANTFNIEFVSIGNPGNAADTTGNPNPVGSVAYTYNMGKFEISEQMIDKANTLGGLGITKDIRGPDKPATTVSWNEAARFVNWLNTSNGSTPAYKFALQPGDVGYSSNALIELWTISDAGYNPTNLYRNSLARYFLPSVDEWYKAAYYDPTSSVYYDYPTASDTAPTAVASGTAAGTAVYGTQTGPADITLAGGLSPYGTIGQGGNVIEWEETDFDLVNGPTDSSSARGVRGGHWFNDSNILHASNRYDLDPSDGLDFIGFRVASTPEPSTLLLLCFGSLAMLWRRRLASRDLACLRGKCAFERARS